MSGWYSCKKKEDRLVGDDEPFKRKEFKFTI